MDNNKVSLEDKHFGHIPKYQVRKRDTLLGKGIRITDGVRHDWSSGTMALLFNDGTFAVFEMSRKWGCVAIMEEPASPEELYGLGLIGREEWDKYKDELDKMYAQSAKDGRRERYLALKKEFENESNS